MDYNTDLRIVQKTQELLKLISESNNDFKHDKKTVMDFLNENKNDLNIGKLTVDVYKYETFLDFNRKLINEFYIINKEKFHDSDLYENKFTLEKKDYIYIKIYPLKKDKFTNHEIIRFDIISQIIFVLFTKEDNRILNLRNLYIDEITGGLNSIALHIAPSMFLNDKFDNYCGVFFNVKNFKHINMKYGNETGNKVLKKIFDYVETFLNKGEFSGRIGGDNFFVFLKKHRLMDFLVYIKEFVLHVEDKENNIPLKIETRAGTYIAKENDKIHHVLENCSTACSLAKQTQKLDVINFDDDTLQKTLFSKYIIYNYKELINNGNFKVYYQPKVNGNENNLIGAEALIRLKLDDEIIPPSNFIPILEESGSIVDIDFFVLEEVCKNISNWLKNGITPVKVSVNFSKQHFQMKDTISNILYIIDKYKVDGKYLEIELTETTNFEDNNILLKFYEEMKSKGISISMDDFGTGYSSLKLLQQSKFDVIKIDKSICDTIDFENDSKNIVLKNIINTINALGLEIISEGVETKEQVEYLKNHGCNLFQGYFFDKPLSLEEFETRLLNKKYDLMDKL